LDLKAYFKNIDKFAFVSDLNWDTRSRQNKSELVIIWLKEDYEEICSKYLGLSNKTRKIPSK